MALQGIISSMVWVLLFSLFSGFSLLSTTTYVYGAKARDNWISHKAQFATRSQERRHTTGACGYGYGKSTKQVYGSNTAAVSSILFNTGLACGACIQIRCIPPTNINVVDNLCKPLAAPVTVTVTDFCPPNDLLCFNSWHFKLSKSAFKQIAANPDSGAIPVEYKWVPCVKKGGIRFTISGWYYMYMVLVTNVGGSGQVKKLMIKGNGIEWLPMERLWGQNWKVFTKNSLVGQPLSFHVTTSNNKVLRIYNVAPATWQIDNTFTSSSQFH